MPGRVHDAQLKFPFGHDERSIADYFRRETGKQVSLTVTDNSTSVLSVRVKGDLLIIRFHRILLGAGKDILGEIAEFVGKRRGKTPLLRKFIREQSGCIRKKPPRRLPVRMQGRYHDLGRIFESVNREYFEGRISASITWGTREHRRAAKRRTLGSYSGHTDTIRINPILDRKAVPRYFIGFIVYHEMLHADMGAEKRNGKSIVHSKEFRKREKAFRDYARAIEWEKNNI